MTFNVQQTLCVVCSVIMLFTSQALWSMESQSLQAWEQTVLTIGARTGPRQLPTSPPLP